MRSEFARFAVLISLFGVLMCPKPMGLLAATGDDTLHGSVDEALVGAELLKLADSDGEVRRDAIQWLANSKVGRVGDALEAYRLGKLYFWQGKLVTATPVEGSGSKNLTLQDALTGQPIYQAEATLLDPPLVVAKADLKSLVASRKERRAVVDAVRVLALYAEDPAVRLNAVKKLGDLRNADYIDELEEVCNQDSNDQVIFRAKESVALLQLIDTKKDLTVRQHAAKELGEMASARAGPLIEDLLENENTDESLRKVCQQSLAQIESYQGVVRVLGYIFSGLSLGSVLILMALGLAIVFGQMGVINMAHGELMMIGAYTTYEVQQVFGHSMPDNPVNEFFWVALVVSFFTTAFVGLLMEKLIVRHLYGRPLETLLATWGVGLMLIQIVRIRYGDNIGVNSPTWLVDGVEVFQDFHLPYNRLFIIGLTVVCVAFVYLLLNHTKRGLLLRATVQNREIAATLGVNTQYEDGFTFAFGAGLAGIAGCGLTLIGGVTPDMGQNYIVDSFLVVVTGGVGEIAGVVCAGLGLGVLNKVLEPMFSTIWGKVLILAFVVAFIQYRPAGLFPPKGRLADV
ncbi:MAG: urea ABC transporter permease subunit UrtB [Pirellulales bacterium]|nr:urea ABC transporter permease subunit UrtB [Pirellulales bacterium]